MSEQVHEIEATWDDYAKQWVHRCILCGATTWGKAPALPCEPAPRDPLGWWAISGSEFLRALHMVADGGDPEMVYAEFYANSSVERVDGE